MNTKSEQDVGQSVIVRVLAALVEGRNALASQLAQVDASIAALRGHAAADGAGPVPPARAAVRPVRPARRRKARAAAPDRDGDRGDGGRAAGPEPGSPPAEAEAGPDPPASEPKAEASPPPPTTTTPPAGRKALSADEFAALVEERVPAARPRVSPGRAEQARLLAAYRAREAALEAERAAAAAQPAPPRPPPETRSRFSGTATPINPMRQKVEDNTPSLAVDWDGRNVPAAGDAEDERRDGSRPAAPPSGSDSAWHVDAGRRSAPRTRLVKGARLSAGAGRVAS